MAGKNYNRIDIKNSTNDEIELNIENSAERIDSFGKIAENQGYKKIMNAILKELKTLTEKDVKV